MTPKWAHLRESPLQRNWYVLPPVIHPIVTKNPFMPILGSISDCFPIVLRFGLPWTASNLGSLHDMG